MENSPESKPQEYRLFSRRISGFTGLILIPYLLLIMFAMLPLALSSPTFSKYPGTTRISEMTSDLPMMVVGYLFGLLGGITRGASENGISEQFEKATRRPSAFFVSGVFGMMTYLAMESGFVLKLIYPDIPSNTEVDLSFRGIAIAAFLVGFFAGETVLYGKRRIGKMNEAEASGEGNK